MLFIRTIFCLLFFELVLSLPQINVYSTEWMDIEHISTNIRHDCIYLNSFDKNSSSRHLISYCLTEWTTNSVPENLVNFSSTFTFSKLKKENITTEDLYRWSASIDTIESYQFYLSGSDEYLSKRLFYNCTSPNFGSQCQYSFDFDVSSYSSLNELINDYYQEQTETQPNILTCYIHLQCNRNLKSICLDWSEICDGKIDCDDGIDESNCLDLTMNQCKMDEYKCNNGQCIPNIFLNNGYNDSQCLDQSDEYSTSIQYSFNLPISSNEDIICSWRQNHTNEYESLTPFSSSCLSQRHANIREAIFFEKFDSTLSNDCLTAIRCHLKISYNHQLFCSEFCENNTCIRIIEQQCPSMFFYPSIPIAFNNVYFLYTNNYLKNWTIMKQIPPEYICYNQELCSGLKFNLSSYVMNNKTCYRFEDFPISNNFIEGNLYSGYIKFVYSQFASCNPTICNHDQMYRCLNSSKCIPLSYIGDKIRDCPYADDETYIIPDRINRKSQQLEFPMTCDGFVDLLPIHIQGQNHTDETECQYWPCNNIYSRCDGIWNCPNGADEINCNPSTSICPKDEFACFSPYTYQMICLSSNKVGDGMIDCIGGTDEQFFLCPRKNRFERPKFYCHQMCIPWEYVCDGIIDCQHGDDENICNSTSKKKSITSQLARIDSSKFYCQRGLPLRVIIDAKRNLSSQVCLCPPQYYGNRCQYQNQRISLTIQVNPSWTSEQTIYTCIVSLIDDSNEQIVHSYEQFSYFYPRDQQTKFNMYLLYANQPKDSTKQYSIKIDLYEMYSLNYRGSVITPVKFSFLPVQRLAIQLDLPKTVDFVQTCDNNRCNHGRCVRSLNEPNNGIFCRCDSGWTGKYCNISYQCNCSVFSFCAGIDANGRSICICPLDYSGPRCGIAKIACSNSSCRNQGFCLPSDEHMTSYKPYTCLCLEGFSGEKCEIVDTKINLTLHKNLHLPTRSLVYFHFINFVDHLTKIHKKNPLIVCGNESALHSYFPSEFQISFFELGLNEYYYIANQNAYNQSLTLHRTIQSSDRCRSIDELFNATFVQLHLIQRMKYYHLPCQNSLNLSCFYDSIFMCLCVTVQDYRSANCFKFNHNIQIENLHSYQFEIDYQCPKNNQSTSTSSTPRSTSATSSVSTAYSTSTTTKDNGVSSVYVGKYYLYLLYLALHLLASYILL